MMLPRNLILKTSSSFLLRCNLRQQRCKSKFNNSNRFLTRQALCMNKAGSSSFLTGHGKVLILLKRSKLSLLSVPKKQQKQSSSSNKLISIHLLRLIPQDKELAINWNLMIQLMSFKTLSRVISQDQLARLLPMLVEETLIELLAEELPPIKIMPQSKANKTTRISI